MPSVIQSAKRLARSILDRVDVLLHNKDYASRFQQTFEQKKWGASLETVSGEGSTMERTAGIRDGLPRLIQQFQIKSMIDAPCGDYYWMKHVDLPLDSYLGLDLVPAIIEKNQQEFAKPPRIQFQVGDLIAGPIPKADLIMIRDCFIHLSLGHIKSVLKNVKDAGITWLLASQSPEQTYNRDIPSGPGCRDINLKLAPFLLPEPRYIIRETNQPELPEAQMALWHRDDLPF
ncbi:MAG: class I SAM-dependent methyltransferase [Planctomycetia bacterium]|nr:class I SAM-dependent methyltransferase [Planctomycetia bacterium]